MTQLARGNVTTTLVGNDIVCLNYDNTGRLAFTQNTNNSLSANISGGPALAVPGAITPNGEANLRTSFSYSSFLGLTTVSGPNGTANTVYDQHGRVTTRISPHGAYTTEAYDYPNRKQTSTTNNRRVESIMDGLGRVVRVETWATGQGSAASIVLTEYGPCACSPTGKVQRESLPYKAGQTVRWRTYTYDAFGRTTQVLEADGVSRTVYEYAGNTTRITDAAGKWKKFTYDAFGNLVKVTEPDPTHGNVDTLYTYDKYDRLTNVSMTRGTVTQTRTFAYYGLTKQLTQTTNPENGTVQYEYSNAHLMWRKTDAKGQKVEYTYDGQGRVTEINRYPGSQADPCQKTKFYYDFNPLTGGYAWGKLVLAEWGGTSCPGGRNFQEMYGYTSGGLPTGKVLRVTELYAGVEKTAELRLEYTYDNEGRVTGMKYPDTYEMWNGGSGPLERRGTRLKYFYNDLGQPVRLATDNGQQSYSDLARSAEYNAAGQMTQLYLVDRSSMETRTYNERLQLSGISWSGVSPSSVQYEYWTAADRSDNNGQVRKTVASGEQITYQYDSLKRLIAATSTRPWGETYTYDGFGNRTGAGAPINASNNRLAGYPYTYDANGNLTGMPQTTLDYNVDNRLVRATHQTNGVDEYGYDPAGQRITKGSLIILYGVDGKRLGEYMIGNVGTDLSNYVWSAYFPNPLQPTEKRWFAGRPLEPVDAVGSRSTGGRFTPYGVEVTPTANDAEKFATYYRDQKTGLDYAMQRYYQSGLGRFLTPDPSAAAEYDDPQSWNLYAYVGSDPINFSDPDGLIKCGDYIMDGVCQGFCVNILPWVDL